MQSRLRDARAELEAQSPDAVQMVYDNLGAACGARNRSLARDLPSTVAEIAQRRLPMWGSGFG
jgi:hypothetical protein